VAKAKAAARKRKTAKRAPVAPVKRAVGRPRIVFTADQERQVNQLAAQNNTFEEIAAVMGVSPDWLAENYSERIKTTRLTGRSSLRRWQWQAAEAGVPALLIWLGKNELGQTDKTVTDHAGDIVIRVVREAVRPDAL